MKVSVVIPAHNSEEWIGASLDSVRAQTRPPAEVLCVSDSSTDGTEDRIREFAPDVQLMSVMHRNAAATRNSAIERATGDWIAFLDADDVWAPDHLERAERLLSGTGDVAYMSGADYFTSDGGTVEPRARYEATSPVSGLAGDEFVRWFCGTGWFCNCTVLARTDRVREVGAFDTTQVRRHDFELFMRLVRGHTWAYEPARTARIRHDTPGSISRSVASCEYFALRGLLKNTDAFPIPEMDELVRRAAKSAMRTSFLAGDAADRARAWGLARAHLPPFERAIYRLASLFPAPARAALRARQGGSDTVMKAATT